MIVYFLEMTLFRGMRKCDSVLINFLVPTAGLSGQRSVFIGESDSSFVTQLLKTHSGRVKRTWVTCVCQQMLYCYTEWR
jgi:hypothetical protein